MDSLVALSPKKCTACSEIKPQVDFPFRKDKGIYRGRAGGCSSIMYQVWRS